MAQLVADLKKKYHLTENTVLRLIDMTLASAQTQPFPTEGEYDVAPPPNDDVPEIPAEGEDAVLAAVSAPEPELTDQQKRVAARAARKAAADGN